MPIRKYGEPPFKYGEGTHYYGEIAEEVLTDFTLGGWLDSGYLNEIHYNGYSKISLPTVFPLQVKGYKIIFYDTTGEKIGELSSETGTPLGLLIEFELIDHGCGSFKMELSELPAELEEVTGDYRVDIHLFGDINPWYSGYILNPPKPGSTESKIIYEGYGYYNQLNDQPIKRSYENKLITYIVRDIISTIIEPETDIVYSALSIINSSIMVAAISWKHISAKDVLSQLSELVLGYQFGVDEQRRFFFRQKDTSINQFAHWWAGKNLQTFIPAEDRSTIRNRLYIYTAENEDEPVCVVDDLVSQALYRVRADKLTMPSILDASLAEEWGNYKLTQLAYPKQTAKITGIEVFKYKIEAKGKARVTSKDGLHTYELPIERVKYRISSNGLEVDVELGEKDKSFTASQLALGQKILTLEQLGDQG